jgi:hypothetical protein
VFTVSSPIDQNFPLLSGAFSASTEENDYGYDSDSENEAESPSRQESPDPETQLRIDARSAYEDDRHFHGTTEASKSSIVQNGFVKDRKDGGAFQQIVTDNPEYPSSDAKRNTDTHHYLAADKESAEDYAGLAAKHQQAKPALVRTIGVNHQFKLRRDPDGRGSSELRTPSDIPASYVLGAKKSPPGPDAAIYKGTLERYGISVSEKEAGELLREVQSDDEDDFKSDSGDDSK